MSSRRLWLWSGCCAVLGAILLSVDMAVANWFAGPGLKSVLPGDLYRLLVLSEVFALGTCVILILALVALLDPEHWARLPRLVCMSLGAGLVADLLKILIVARVRPQHATDLADVGATFVQWFPLAYLGRNLQSFPSAHAATAVGLCVALSACYPRGRVLFVFFAALACLQRVECGAHFSSDTLWGAAVGLAVAGFVTSNLWPRRLGPLRT